MGCITAFLLLCNILLIIAADVLLWLYSATMGLFGLIGVAAFFVGYAFSNGMSIAISDFWANPEFNIFIKKVTFANVTALMAWGGTLIIAALCENEAVMNFFKWTTT